MGIAFMVIMDNLREQGLSFIVFALAGSCFSGKSPIWPAACPQALNGAVWRLLWNNPYIDQGRRSGELTGL